MEPALCRSPVPAQLRAPRDAGQQQDTAPSRLRESGGSVHSRKRGGAGVRLALRENSTRDEH